MRIEKEKTDVIYFRLDSDMKAKIQEVAKDSQMTLSKYIRGLVIEDIANTSITRSFIVIQELERELIEAHTQLGHSKLSAKQVSKALKLADGYLRVYK